VTRALKLSLASLAVLLIAAACAIGYAIGTSHGTAFLITQASKLLSDELVVEGLAGALLDGVSAERVTYSAVNYEIDGADVSLQIRLTDLFDGVVTLERCRAATVTVTADEFDQQIDSVELTGRATTQKLSIDRLSGSLDGFELALVVDVAFEPLFPMTGTVEWSDASGTIAGSGSVSGDLDILAFSHALEMSASDPPFAVEFDGQIRSILTGPAIEANAAWESIVPPVDALAGLESRTGRARIEGTPDDYRILVTTSLYLEPDMSADAQITAHGNLQSLTIDDAKLAGFGGEITLSGDIELSADPAFTLTVKGEGLDPGQWQRGLAGELGFSATIDGKLREQIHIELLRADGMLQEIPFEASGIATLADGSIKNSDFNIHSGENTLRFSAANHPNLTGSFQLDAPRLAGFWPGLAGQLNGDGSLAGTIDEPIVSVRLTGENLAFEDQQMAKLFVDGRIEADGRLALTVSALSLQTAKTAIGDLKLSGVGDLAEHDIKATVTGGPADLQIRSTGAWTDAALVHRVTALSVDLGVPGVWTLRDPADVEIAAERGVVSPFCLDNAPAWLCADEIRWSEDLLIAGVKLSGFQLGSFNPWLGADLELAGTADAELSLQRRPDDIQVGLQWHQQNTRLMHGEELETNLQDVNVTLTATSNEAVLRAEVTGDYGLQLSANATLQDPLADDGILSGRLRAEVPDLAEVSVLIGRFIDTTHVSGRVDAEIELAGTRSDPILRGRASLSNGAAGIPVAGIELTDVIIDIVGQDDGALSVTGSARSGEGGITIDGTLKQSEALGIFADIDVRGEDFEILRLTDQYIQVSPDFNARFDDNRIIVSGDVVIPRAQFVVEELATLAVDVSTDVIVHGREADAGAVLLPGFVGELNVQLGDEVTFEGFGIATRLTGGMKVARQPAGLATGEGSLQLVDGQFSIYGKTLTIERGSLNFFGPLNDPVINVRASRRLRYEDQEIKVGVILSGQISKQLEFRMFSEPPMSERDVVSYLVLDRPASTAEGDDSAVLSAAALNLGLQSVTQGVTQGLGLDEVGIEGTGGSDTAVAAGKRLNEDLYVRYTYGLFNKIGTFIVRYYLGKGFSIVAGSGEQQSLDLVYSIER
jgi:translocation and assembly module TamB